MNSRVFRWIGIGFQFAPISQTSQHSLSSVDNNAFPFPFTQSQLGDSRAKLVHM